MECFSYSGGYDVTCIEAVKEELAWAIEKWLHVIINIMSFKTVIAQRNKE